MATKSNKRTGGEFGVYASPIQLDVERPEVFECSTDRAKRVLMQHGRTLNGGKDWIAPFSLLLALLTALISSDFKKALGLDPSTWKAVFVISLIFSVCWLAKVLFYTWKNRHVNIDVIVEKLRSNK
jgi:hypothetical protein